MLEFKDVSVVFHEGTTLEKKALDNVSIHIRPGEFVTILGSNGAGKSTFFNAISGLVSVKSGQILLEGKDITHLAPRKRAKIIGRLYQNPAQGTAPHLSVEENLALSDAGGKPLLGFAAGRKSREYYKEVLRPLDMGLEERMKTPIGQLSGGQRQAAALMMAALHPPKLILFDEHTAALDPKTAKKVLALTNQLVEKEHMTALMITHNMKDALENGNRLLIFQDGRITHDFSQEEKSRLQLSDLIEFYEGQPL